MFPDRLSRRVALSLVFLVAILVVIAGCKKEAAPPPTGSAAEPALSQTATTGSAAEPALSQTATTAEQPLMAEKGVTTATDTATMRAAAAVPCTAPDKTRSRPVVCVDAKALKVNPKSITMIDFVPGPGNHPSGTPVRIFWRTTTGTGDLQVKFAANNGCVTPPNCNQAGECSATALPHQNPRKSTTCQYTVSLDGKDADPVVVVEPCCP